MMETGTNHTGQTGIKNSTDEAVNMSLAEMTISQGYIDRLIIDLFKSRMPVENMVTTLITSQEGLDQLVDDLVKNTVLTTD